MSPRSIQSAPTLDGGHGTPAARVLVAERNESVGRELIDQLRGDGYLSALAGTAEHARVLARAQPIRAIVLGTLEPPRGSLDLLEEIRRRPAKAPTGSVWEPGLPAIVLSPTTAQLDLLRAFEIGTDDYIVTTGSYYLELRVRLKALLRRVEQQPLSTRLRVGPLDIDTGAHLVRVDGMPVDLCRLEYQLLVHLAHNPAGVCSKQELLNAIWRQRGNAGARTVDSHASRLRRKLYDAGARGLVVNVWGVGYRLL